MMERSVLRVILGVVILTSLALIQVVAADDLTASFTSNVTNGVAPLAVQFNDTSSNTPTGWNWSFRNVTGNNTEVWFSTEKNATYSFGVGNWLIRLNATNESAFNISTQTTFINVSAGVIAPTASFTVNITAGAPPLSIQFIDTSIDNPSTWSWVFNNKTGNDTYVAFSTDQNPVYTFEVGNWSINLTASNIKGSNISTQVTFINVSMPVPVASFTANATSGIDNLTVKFNDTSTNAPLSWNWTFQNVTGNNTRVEFSTEKNVTYSFGVGNWSIVLNATSIGGTNTSLVTFVNISPIQILTPITSFTSNTTTGVSPADVQFIDTTLNAPTAWSWLFTNITDTGGNGTEIEFSTTQNPLYTFGVGSWLIRLNTSNTEGYNLSTQVTYINITETFVAPVADFTTNVTFGAFQLAVQFNDTSSNAPTAWNWSFGDGTYNNTRNPSKLYVSSNNYTVILNASNSAGYSTKTKYITVGNRTNATFTSNVTSGSDFIAVKFNDTSKNATAWNWSFRNVTGNNTEVWFSTEKNVTYSFGAGNWSIKLNASNTYAYNISTQVTFINVSTTATKATFTVNVTGGEYPVVVQFNDTSTNNPTAWSWRWNSTLGSYNSKLVFLLHMNGTNGGYSFFDSSPSNKTVISSGVFTNTTDPRFGSASAYYSSTGTDFLQTASSADFGLGSTWTIQFWIKSSQWVGTNRVIWYNMQPNAPGYNENFLTVEYDYISVGNYVYPTGYPIYVLFNHGMSLNEWHHVVVQQTNTTNIQCWVDGIEAPRYVFAMSGSMPQYSGVNYIGSDAWGHSLKNTHLDEVAFWKGSAIPITALYPITREIASGITYMEFNTSQNTTYSFLPGNWSIRLNATNSFGSNISNQTWINVSSPRPITSFTTNITEGFSPAPVQFVDTTMSPQPYPVLYWSWSFQNITPGNNTRVQFSTTQNPTYTLKAGNWSIMLNTTNAANSNSSATTFINVSTVTPIVSFTSNATTGNRAPYTVQFTDTSLRIPTSWCWTFTNMSEYGGNGTEVPFSTAQNPVYTFTIGTWSIKLNVSNAAGFNTTTTSTKINVSNITCFPTITNVGLDTVVTFTNEISCNWTPVASTTVRYLVVGGGGGGGQDTGGGGGAGAFREGFGVTISTEQTVIVGTGGLTATAGNDSQFGDIIAKGGGAGGYKNTTGNDGGSGGGGGGWSTIVGWGPEGGLTLNSSFGNDGGGGGHGYYWNPTFYYGGIAGGGGGAGTVGDHGRAGDGSGGYGNGGTGRISNITGTDIYYAGGGGGGGGYQMGAGAGSAGGGGAGGYDHEYGDPLNKGKHGTDGLGGGGGGNGNSITYSGNHGGSGVVIIRYSNAVADSQFLANVTSGTENVAVQFTDGSINSPTGWNWSFQNITGNNTEVWFSQTQNPVYTFGVGNWSIKLNASNSTGFNISPQETIIFVTPSGSSACAENTHYNKSDVDTATILTFTGTNGSCYWTIPSTHRLQYLVVGGGGGGGDYYGGGGGGGAVIQGTEFVNSSGDIRYVQVAGVSGNGGGLNTTFGDIIATGGGYGGGTNKPTFSGGNGSSGGGGSESGSKGYANDPAHGHDGGDGSGSGAGGGGGGASTSGNNGTGSNGGNGGDGIQSFITGNYYGGGGGGGGAGNGGAGGLGGGGSANGDIAAVPNSGGGGAGWNSSYGSGENGASGIIVLKYSLVSSDASFEVNATSGYTPTTIKFNDTSISTFTNWSWSFKNITGNNTDVIFSTDQNPTYAFSNGNWSIKLNASNNTAFNISVQTTIINISSFPTAPTPSFTHNFAYGIGISVITFNGSYTGGLPESWSWSFQNVTGNNTRIQFSTEKNVTYPFGVGNWSVMLNATNAAGTGSTDPVYLPVNPRPSTVAQYNFTVDGYTLVIFGGADGNTNWSVPPGVGHIDYLVVAGGGSGGSTIGGGGGAGGVLNGTGYHVTYPLVYNITVGAGGAIPSASETAGFQGKNSTFGIFNASGGGAGGDPAAGGAGGSGGGGGRNNKAGGSGIAGQGYAGSAGWSNDNIAGGGGGASEPGYYSTSILGGSGGNGIQSNITGTLQWYAGGGGGGVRTGNTPGTGGLGGGGAGSNSDNGGAGINGTGGGGGGAGYAGTSKSGGAGGLGIVILKYRQDSEAAYSVNSTTGYEPLPIQFMDNSTNSPIAWIWSFTNISATGGNGTEVMFSTEQNPVYTFPPGNWTFKLYAQNMTGYNTSLQSTYINVSHLPDPPEVSFVANNTGGPAPIYVKFNDTSTGNTTVWWNWSFQNVTGNNTEVWFSQSKNVSMRFDNGNFSIRLNASNYGGGNISPPTFINVSAVSIPVSSFTANSTSGQTPVVVKFNDTTENVPAGWNWSFRNVTGNNTQVLFSSLPNVTYTFKVGNWSIQLNTTNYAGGNSSAQTTFINVSPVMPTGYTYEINGATVIVINGSPGNLNWTPPSGVTNVSILLVAGGGAGGGYFGGGGGGGGVVSCTSYSVASDTLYVITLGAGGTRTTGAGTGTNGTNSSISNATFSLNATGGGIGAVGGGTATTPHASAGGSGGGGGSSTGHLVAGSGITGQGYTGGNALTVSGNYGSGGGGGATANGSTGGANGGDGGAGFTSSISGTPVTYGGGGGGAAGDTGGSAVGTGGTGGGGTGGRHYLATGNVYTAATNGTNNLGGGGGGGGTAAAKTSGTYGGSGIIIIQYTQNTATFTANSTSGVRSASIQFTDTSSNFPTVWAWSFTNISETGGNGTEIVFSTNQNPVYTFDIGNWSIRLNASNSTEFNISTQTTFINISGGQTLQPNFTMSNTSGWTPTIVNFTDTTDGYPISWNWSFGDTTFSESQNPVHTFTNIGNYSVTLTVTNEAGSNNITQYVVVDGVSHYQNITEFTINSTVNLTDYQVMLTVYNTSGATSVNGTAYTDGTTRPDWNDIVFTDYSNNILSFWKETNSETATNATFWIKIPEISNVNSTKVLMVYGNTSATTSFSNGTTTFIMFDDFTGTMLDTSKWNPISGSFTVSNGIMNHCTASGRGLLNAVAAGTNNNTVLRSRLRTTLQGSTDSGTALSVKQANNGDLYSYSATTRATTGSPISWIEANVAWGSQIDSFTYTNTTWFIGDIVSNGTYVKFKKDNSVWYQWSKSARSGYLGYQTWIGSTGTQLSEFDWAAVRSYTDAEPVINVSISMTLSATFTMNVTTGIQPVAVQFIDTSSSNTSAWNWSFTNITDTGGNGTEVWFSQVQHPVYTFDVGNWSIKLNASNTTHFNTSPQTTIINVTPATLAVATFTTNVTSGIIPFSVTLNDTSSNRPTSWNWSYTNISETGGNGTEIWFANNTKNTSASFGVGNWSIRLAAINAAGVNISTQVTILNVSTPVTHYQYTIGNETVIIFNGTNGTAYWIVPEGVRRVNYLIIAGGGGGGTTNAGNAGGGGAGGYLNSMPGELSGNRSANETPLTVAEYTGYWVVIGGGGGSWQNGTNSSIANATFSLTATGGGAGGYYGNYARSGGSGGGAGQYNGNAAYLPGGSGTPYQGTAGASTTTPNGYGGSGGGGANNSGMSGYGTNAREGGYGGHGLLSNITGNLTWRAGGGAGSAHGTATNGTPLGGLGGGGAGHYGTANASNGTPNTGSGGGGGGENYATGYGGSGIIVLRFTTSVVGASFIPNETSGTALSTIQFNDISGEIANGNPATAWNWSFTNISETGGNGTEVWFSQEQHPTWVFNSGNFSIKLNASNADGYNISVQTTFINITSPPVTTASFTMSNTSGWFAATIQFTDTSNHTPLSWNWSFGDGTYSEAQNPVHLYSISGNYSITLTATNIMGSNTSPVSMIYVGNISHFTKKVPFLIRSDVNLTDYQVMLKVYNFTGTAEPHHSYDTYGEHYTNGSTRANWNDVVFTDTSYNLLSFWKEDDVTPYSAMFWIKIPNISSIDDTVHTTKIYMFYGNDTIPTTFSNGYNTFDFFDDFNATPLNATLLNLTNCGYWNTSNCSANPVNLSNWNSNYNTNQSDGWLSLYETSVQSNTAYDMHDHMLGGRHVSDTTGDVDLPLFGYHSTNSDYFAGFVYYYWAGSPYVAVRGQNIGSGWSQVRFTGVGVNTYPYHSELYIPSYVKMWTTDIYGESDWEIVQYNIDGTGPKYVYLHAPSGRVQWYDYVYLREWANTYPYPEITTDTLTAGLTANRTYGHDNVTIQFTDISEGMPTGWNWSFINISNYGGNDTEVWWSTETNPIYRFGVGNWSIKLNVSNTTHYAISSYAFYINVSPTIAPIAYFTQSVNSGTAPVTVTFTDTSYNIPTGWNWSYRNVTGNNTEVWFNQSQNPTDIFAVGNWSIRLNASNYKGYNISTQTSYLNVSPPVAIISHNYTGGAGRPVPIPVQFTDSSTGTNTNWSWSFQNISGNNTAVEFSTNQSPKYSFGVGNWSIRLNISNGYSENSSPVTPILNITEPIPLNFSLDNPALIVTTNGRELWQDQANTAWMVKNGTVAYIVSYGNGEGYGQPVTYTHKLDTMNVSVQGIQNITFWVKVIGDYPPTPHLDIYDNDVLISTHTGFEDWHEEKYSTTTPGLHVISFMSDVSEYHAIQAWVDNFTVEGNITASFYSNITGGNAPLAVQFNDTSSNSPSMWNWSFRNVTGNNTEVWFSQEQNPVYVFGTGNWQIQLNATNAFSTNITSGSYFINVSLNATPVASFTSNVTSGNPPLAVQFTDTSAGFPTAWNWSFTNISETGGNGTEIWFSQEQNATYTFGVGNWLIAMNASNVYGENSSPTTFINVTAAITPVTNYSLNTTSGITPLTIQFNDTSTNYPNAFKWWFRHTNGNDTKIQFSSARDPVYTFTNGTYNITHWSSNDAGENESPVITTITVTGIDPPPPAGATRPISLLHFNGTSYDEILGLYWDTGGGTVTFPASPKILGSGSAEFSVYADSHINMSDYNDMWDWGDHYTIEMWVKPQTRFLTTEAVLFGQGDPYGWEGYNPGRNFSPFTLVYDKVNQRVGLYGTYTGDDWDLVGDYGFDYGYTEDFTVPIGGWTHIEVDYDYPGIKIFLNGTEYWYKNDLYDRPWNSPFPMQFGGSYGGYYDGWMDEVTVWNITRHWTNFTPNRSEHMGNIPVASFITNYTTGAPPPAAVQFTDTSPNTSLSWNWTFRDVAGNNTEITFSQNQSPVHSFGGGNWSIRLNASNDYGWNYTKYDGYFINVSTENHFINPGFELNSFTGWSGTIEYFGFVLSSTIRHTGMYSAYDNYYWSNLYQYVNLTGSKNVTFWVYSAPWRAYTFLNPFDVMIGDTLVGSYLPPPGWSQYSFDTHEYATRINNTTVNTLFMVNTGGTSDLYFDDFVINMQGQEPVADWLPSGGIGEAIFTTEIPYTINFTDRSTNNATSWVWSFGDGTFSTDQNPTHTYTTRGQYNITLNATNAYGSGTRTRPIYILTNILHNFQTQSTLDWGENLFNGKWFGSHEWSANGDLWYLEDDQTYIYPGGHDDPVAQQGVAYLGNHTIITSNPNFMANDFGYGEEADIYLSYANISRSTNDGLTWETKNYTMSENIYHSGTTPDFHFANMGDGIVYGIVAGDGDVYMSTDYGATGWNTTLIARINKQAQPYFIPRNILYIGNGVLLVAATNSSNSELYTSTDYGVTWNRTSIIQPGEDWVDEMRYIGNNTLLVTNDWDGLQRSTNLGQTWQTVSNPEWDWMETVVNIGEGVVLAENWGDEITVWRSDDWGETWSKVNDTAWIDSYWSDESSYLLYAGDNTVIMDRDQAAFVSHDLGVTWNVTSAIAPSGGQYPLLTGGEINWTYTVLNGTRTVQFNDTSTNVPTVWNWSFGDGTYSNQKNPIHTYTAGGTSYVTLETYNVNEFLSKSQWITLTNYPVSNTSGISIYSPHRVRFLCVDTFGAPLVGMNVSAIGVESTLGNESWVSKIFGLNLNETPILNTLMTATTGNDGAVVFLMIETEKYRLDYTMPSKGINETRYYYPKEESYLERFWTESPVLVTPTVPVCGAPTYNYSVLANGTNPDYVDLHIGYSDCSAGTATMTFYVTDVTDNKTKKQLYVNNMSTPNNIDITYPVLNASGASYRFGITGRTTTGVPVYQENLYRIAPSNWRMNFMKFENDDPVAPWFYNTLAVAFIFLFGLVFSRASMKQGVVIVPLIGLFFWWAGWLQTTLLLVTVAIVLGVLFYLRYAEEEAQL